MFKYKEVLSKHLNFFIIHTKYFERNAGFHSSGLLSFLKDPWWPLQSVGSPKICAFYVYIQGHMTEDDRQENNFIIKYMLSTMQRLFWMFSFRKICHKRDYCQSNTVEFYCPNLPVHICHSVQGKDEPDSAGRCGQKFLRRWTFWRRNSLLCHCHSEELPLSHHQDSGI